MADEVVLPRRNGWSCPWHPLQCLAWFFIFFFALLHFGILGHYVVGYWRILVFVVPVVILAVLVVSMVMATSINPAERIVREKLPRGKITRAKFDSSKYPHVILNNYCHLCQVNVSASAKHCKSCDKCIMDFDHHCKWLNNCVGSRNYKWFLSSVWTALIGLVPFLILSLSLFIVYFIEDDASLLRFNCPTPSNLTACDSDLRLFGIRLPSAANPVFPSLCAVFAVLALVALVFLTHLAVFHIYLKVKGQSTYDYFVQSRRERDAKPHPSSKHRVGFFRGKMNRVTPVDADTAHVCDPKHASLEVTVSQQSSLQSIRSDNSIGNTTFSRTPPPVEMGNLTDEQKLGLRESSTDITCDKDLLAHVTVEAHDQDSTVPRPPLYGVKECDLPQDEPRLLSTPPMARCGEQRCDQTLVADEKSDSDCADSDTPLTPHSDTPLTPQIGQAVLVHSLVSLPVHNSSSHAPLPDATPFPGATPIPDATNSQDSSHSSLLVSSPDSNDRGPLIETEPLMDRVTPTLLPTETSMLIETPLPPIVDRSGVSVTPIVDRSGVNVTPLPSGSFYTSTETPLHKRVSFQDLHQDDVRPTSRSRPLPPIGSNTYCDDPFPPRARRLPPLTPLDTLSLYSASSNSQLFSRPASTHSLPLPDPRYSSAPRPGPLWEGKDTRTQDGSIDTIYDRHGAVT